MQCRYSEFGKKKSKKKSEKKMGPFRRFITVFGHFCRFWLFSARFGDMAKKGPKWPQTGPNGRNGVGWGPGCAVSWSPMEVRGRRPVGPAATRTQAAQGAFTKNPKKSGNPPKRKIEKKNGAFCRFVSILAILAIFSHIWPFLSSLAIFG